MPSFCVVHNCNDKYGHSNSISFHKFPFRRKDLLQKWMAFAARGSDWKPTKWSAICSQHFKAEDFNCLNWRKTLKKTAVPSIRPATDNRAKKVPIVGASDLPSEKLSPLKKCKTHESDDASADEQEEDSAEGDENSNIPEITTTLNNIATESNCRLCGGRCSAAVSFTTNFEIFGMVQKCFPTLNIQPSDNLPKYMCHNCLKRVKDFSEFIDNVLDAQRELQQKFRTEKPPKPAESKTLKIKQEPVVNVKQEISEGFDSFLSDDLDIGIDDCCDQDGHSADQKFGFYDFPALNTQDIINNCDIMEIINLDDPFINIPDDDPGCNDSDISPQSKSSVLSAALFLQRHLICDEHNYACLMEDMKEEWQIKKSCKTEEVEGSQAQDIMPNAHNRDDYRAYVDTDNIGASSRADSLHGNGGGGGGGRLKNFSLQAQAKEINERSSKPIVTSVSEIAESRVQFHADANVANGHTVDKPYKDTFNKPNIVVLNESIVQSPSAFQLHACSMCHLKFFSVQSLDHHINAVHLFPTANAISMPMVILPDDKLAPLPIMSDKSSPASLLTDSNRRMADASFLIDHQPLSDSGINIEDCTEKVLAASYPSLSGAANQDGPRSPLLIDERPPTSIIISSSTTTTAATTTTTITTMATTTNAAVAAQEKHNVEPLTHERLHFADARTNSLVSTWMDANASEMYKSIDDGSPAECSDLVPVATVVEPTKVNINGANGATCCAFKQPKQRAKRQQTEQQASRRRRKRCIMSLKDNVLRDYKYLQYRYRLLLHKCQTLFTRHEELARDRAITAVTTATTVAPKRKTKCQCPKCERHFANIYQLLRHKRGHHPALRRLSAFWVACPGCGQHFSKKLALINHMKYICQSLSLRWFKRQMQTHKCRFCRSISFTHWRLFRNHEVMCRRKLEQRRRRYVKYRSAVVCPTKLPTLPASMPTTTIATPTSTPTSTIMLTTTRPDDVGNAVAGRPSNSILCTMCERRFNSLTSLQRHHVDGACARPWFLNGCSARCGGCFRYFRELDQLRAHNRQCRPMANDTPLPCKAEASADERRLSFVCHICQKPFSNRNLLYQHGITHTEERRHKCTLCMRSFKRRGGLTQHLKSYHLQLKPHKCSVCSHRYALKCDMKRCRHSLLQKLNRPAPPVTAIREE